MKTLVIILISISITFVFALPFEESNKTVVIEENDGWFVPQVDGSLKWMTTEEAAKTKRQLLMGRWKRKINGKFFLYTRRNPDEPEQIFDNPMSILRSNFNSSHSTRFIIHGYLNGFTSPVNREVRSSYLDAMECNIICVDWSDKAMSVNYMKSKSYVPKVGEKIAEIIDLLVTEGNMSLDDLQLIGHSLGAHVAGFAGKHVTTGEIHSIIGLDPAWPLYTFADCSNRLCVTDALYVETIHTNGGLLGFLEPIGHADFYAHGGVTQPGCGLDVSGACSHFRAFHYYAESIAENNFVSRKCSHWRNAVLKTCKEDDTKSIVKFGNYLNSENVEGYYFTPINSQAPYGKGKFMKLLI